MNRGKRLVHAWTWMILLVTIAGFSLGALVARWQTDDDREAWVTKASQR